MSTVESQYELTKELGRGGAATVWEARHRQTGEIVAVKILSPELLAAPKARKRFLREVTSASALRHPHSVRVMGHGQTQDGGGFLVMERLFGRTLATCLRDVGPLPPLRAIKIACQILEAVGAAHRLHIVHRDLKPSNVMLIEQEGDLDFVKVCDFGLAKAIDPHDFDGDENGVMIDFRSVNTQEGEICGTPEYMAPEQARGEPIDGRADLYAIAVMLFHAVVGQVPFSGRTILAVVSQHLASSPPRPSALRPDLGIFPPLEALILRGLAKDRAERPSSAEVFRADLLQIERDYRRRVRPSSLTTSVPALVREGDTLPAGSSSQPQPSKVLPWSIVAVGLLLSGLVAALLWRSTLSHVAAGPAASPDGLGPVSALESRGEAVSSGTAHPEESRDRSAVAGSTPEVSALVAQPSAAPRPAVVEALPAPARRAAPAAGDRALDEKKRGERMSADLLVQAEDRLARGRVDEACALGDAAAVGASGSPDVWEFLGRCYMRLGQAEKARAHYRKYLALSPDGPNAVFIRAILESAGP